MNLRSIVASFIFSIMLLIPFAVFATNNLPTSGSMPDVIYLRINCEALQNCATTMEEVVSWIGNTRMPNAASRLTVDIGPGQFGPFSCTNGGYTTLRGAGRTNTTIGGPDAYIGVAVLNCADLDFENLRITKKTGTFNTINWTGGGSSTWSNVDVIGSGYGWVDMDASGSAAVCTSQSRSVHYWFNSRIVTKTDVGLTKGYVIQCSESWFFGSEITAKVTASSPQAFALSVSNSLSEAHVYGSVIRTVAAPGIVNALTGVLALNAKLHIHGTGIDVIGNGASSITALYASGSGGEIHANVSAYNLSTGTGGSITRIFNNGSHVHAPYLWEEHSNPPNITSVNGADMAMVTGGTSDGHPHLVVYDSSCASKWYDTTDKICRP